MLIENWDYDAPSVGDLGSWASDYGLSHPVLADPGMGVSYGYIGTTGATTIGLPSKQLIGPGMEVLAVHESFISASMIEAHLPD